MEMSIAHSTNSITDDGLGENARAQALSVQIGVRDLRGIRQR